MITPWEAHYAATTERMYGAAHPAPPPHPEQETSRDLLDFCSSFGDVELKFNQLARLLVDAAECDAQRIPTLRAHRDDLRHIQAELAALVAEAEAA